MDDKNIVEGGRLIESRHVEAGNFITRLAGRRSHDWTCEYRERDNATNMVIVAKLCILILFSISYSL